jgi:hypothetical protein
MIMKRAKIVGLGTLAGLAAGALLHLALGSRIARAPAVEAPRAKKAGAAESDRSVAESAARLDELRKKIEAAERDCAELRAKRAAAPAPLSRRQKAARIGRLVVRMISSEGQPAGAELQKHLSEMMALSQELGLNPADASALLLDSDVMSALFRGFLEEAGVATTDAALEAWESEVFERLRAIPKDAFLLRVHAVQGGIMVDLFERFGKDLFEKNPVLARKLSDFGSTSKAAYSGLTRAQAVDRLIETVRRSAGVDKDASAVLRPAAERWVAAYAERVEAARARHAALPSYLVAGQIPSALEPAQALELTIEMARLKSALLAVEAEAVEEMAAALPPDSAQKLKKFQTILYFGDFKPE